MDLEAGKIFTEPQDRRGNLATWKIAELCPFLQSSCEFFGEEHLAVPFPEKLRIHRQTLYIKFCHISTSRHA
jgi:hypothetical protein